MNEYERKASVLPKTIECSEGSNGVPELKLITSGTRTGSSLNFYLQIGNSVYKYLVYQASTTPENITLFCEQGRNCIPKEKRCSHKVELIILNAALINSKEVKRTNKRRADGTRREPYIRTVHTLDKALQESRVISNYLVQEIFPAPPAHICKPCQLMAPLQDDFLENTVKQSLAKKKIVFEAEVQQLPLQWPPQIKANIHGHPTYKKKLLSARICRRFTSLPTQVSENSKTMAIFNNNPNHTFHPDNVQSVKFLQSQITNKKGLRIIIWLLENEFELLDDHANINLAQLFASPVFIDGTFNFVSKLKEFAQQYSLVRYYTSEEGKKGLSYPICFMWLPDKTQDTYRTAFGEIRRLFLEKCGYELVINTWRLDFETNPKKIIKEYWPDAEVKGCQFHYEKAIQDAWKRKLGEKVYVYNKGLRAETLDIYAGMPFVEPVIFLEAIRVLEKEIIPNLESATLRKKLEDFHEYFVKQWINKRHCNADWNLHSLLQKGDIFWTTNQSESLHLALKKSYKTPPASIRAASDILHDYKAFYLGKFSNEFYAYRKKESLERCQQIQYLHSEIESQPLEWKINNAISICSQFSVPSAQLLDFQQFHVTSELVFTSL